MECPCLLEHENHHARKVDPLFPDAPEKDLFGEPSLEVPKFGKGMYGLGVVTGFGKYQELVELL